MTRQNPVSLQIPIIPDQLAAVSTLLNTGKNPATKDSFFAFHKIPTVHFARWIIAPQTVKFPPSLIYAANIDGDQDEHLKDLVKYLFDELNQILSHCIDYPDQSNRNPDHQLTYLKKYVIKTPGFYVGAPNRTVQQVHQEAQLHRAVRDFTRDHGKNWSTPREAYAAIKEFLVGDPKWDWARQNYHLPKKQYVMTLLLAILLILLLPLLIIFVILIHFFYELRAKPFGITQNQIPLKRLAELKSQEDIIYQNQLSQVFETKGGLRRLGLKFFLWATSYAARTWFVEGQLMGTPTIHFARWVLIDGGKRFVFFSNFDGSFDEYLGDFVDNNGWGLNAIYGAAKGYPRTFFMFGGGSYKVLEFMGWGRRTQVPTPIWYSAYPWYGQQQIVDKSKLRVELFNSGELNDAQIKTMLKRI